MSWIIETKKQLKYDIEQHNPDLITYGPWYNTSICTKSHATVFEKYVINERTDRYNLMFSIDAHEKQRPSYVYDGISCGGHSLPSNLTTESLVSLSATIDFIDFWLKCFDRNYLSGSNMYIETMPDLYKKS